MFFWFFLISVALHRCLCIWKCSHLSQTLWTDFGKGSLSPMGEACGGMLWPQVEWCRGVWLHQFQGHRDVSLIQFTGVHSIDNCMVFGKCYSVCSGNKGILSPQWHLQVQFPRTTADSSGDESWWYTYTQLWGPAARGMCSGRGWLQMYVVVAANAGSLGWGQLWAHWLVTCTAVPALSHRGHMAVEAADGDQAGCVQGHSWRV